MSHSKNNSFIIFAIPAPISHRTAEENLGIGYLSAVLRKNGYEVLVLDGWLNHWSLDTLVAKILAEKTPLFVGVSAYQSNIDQAIKVLSKVKQQKDIKFVAGGFGPTFSPDMFLNNGFDAAIRGEGEDAILAIAKNYRDKQALKDIPNVSYRSDNKNIHNPMKPIGSDLNQIPHPCRDTMHLAIDRCTPVHLLTARGCSGSCAFCSIAAFFRLSKTSKWRGRNIADIIDEMRELQGMGVKHVKIIDDSFIDGDRDEKWCHEFARQIKQNNINLALRSSIRADKVTDQIAYDLKEAGFFSFSCGIENFSESALRRMAKDASVAQNLNALDIFRKYDFYVQAGQILFDPYTTVSELNENYKHMTQYDWIISKGVFTEMFAAKGTAFQKKLEKNNLTHDHNARLGNYAYNIQDERARIVYDALKMWHVGHMKFYDKAIDPMTSPKALNKEQMQDFYAEYKNIRSIDLSVMGGIIKLVQNNASRDTVIQFVESELQKTQTVFQILEKRVDALYQKCNLVYDAAINPFIKVR